MSLAYNAPPVIEPKTFSRGYIFGAPVKDLGWITSLIMGVAAGVMSFFVATFLGIVTVMILIGMGHAADYTMSYRLIGLPIGLAVMIFSLGYLGTFWVKRILRGK